MIKIQKKIKTNITSEEYIYDYYYILNLFNEKDKYYHFEKVIELKKDD